MDEQTANREIKEGEKLPLGRLEKFKFKMMMMGGNKRLKKLRKIIEKVNKGIETITEKEKKELIAIKENTINLILGSEGKEGLANIFEITDTDENGKTVELTKEKLESLSDEDLMELLENLLEELKHHI